MAGLLAVSSISGFAQEKVPTAGPESFFARAVELHQKGDLEGAIQNYRAFLQARPESVEARSNLGAALARLGRFKEAIEQYRTALSIDDQNHAIRFNLGVAHYKAAQFREATHELSKVVAAQPGNLNALILLSDCYLLRGEYKKVIELLSPLENAQRQNRAFLYVLGTALIRGGEVERGQQVIDQILRHGDSAEARLLLGTARMMARDYPGAVQEFRKAVEAAPNLPGAHSLYGRAILATGGRDQALEGFRRELELNPNDYEANLYLGVLLRQDRHDAQALGYLQRALEIRPGAPEARYQIGSLYLAIGNAEEARKVLEGLVRDIPSFVEAHVSLATAYYRLKRKEDGDRHRAIAEKLNAEIQARAPGASAELGPAYRGETTPAGPTSANGADEIAAMEARSAVQAASAPSPFPPPPAVKTQPVAQQTESFEELAQRAHAAREGERFEEAISLYQEALKMRPTWSEGWWYLGTVYYGQDRYDEAVGPLRRLVALEPQGGAGWALLGLSEFQIRDYDRALEHLQRAQALRISSNPQLWQVVRFRLAQLLTRSQQYESAILHYHALVRDRGENASLIESMGIATMSLPYLPTELPPDKRELVMMAGRAQYFVAARNMEEARRHFQQLVERYPTTPNVHYAYGVFLLRDSHDEAIEEFKKELAISPSHVSARLQIAFEYLRRAEGQAGLDYAREAVRLAPHSFAARNAYGRCLLETGDVENAIRELEEGVRLAPDSPETRYALARAYARAGRRDDAARERAEFAKLDKIRRGLAADTGGDSESSPDQRPPI